MRKIAIRFIEWALTPEAQAIAGDQGESFQIQSNVNTEQHPLAPNFDEINLIEYDFDHWGDPEVRDQVLTTWINEIFAIPR